MHHLLRVFVSILIILTISAIPLSTTLSQNETSQESAVFQRLRDGVVTVYGDVGHGSGFLVDQKGIFVTNQHVVARSSHIKIQINDSVCVKALLLVEDVQADIAILRIHPYWASSLPVLPLRPDSLELVRVGEKVFAIANPLSQTRTHSVGVVSMIGDSVFLSDVDLVPGNAGGPLLNLTGEVVGIASYTGRHPDSVENTSGIVPISLAVRLIDSAQLIADTEKLPPPELLPVLSKDIFPLRALEDAASQKKMDRKAYALSRGNFNVQLLSPTYAYWTETQHERRLAAIRARRVASGKSVESTKYDFQRGLRNWYQYHGEYPPVVVIAVLPKVGETKGSILANLVGAAITIALGGPLYFGYHSMEFKAALKDLAMMSKGEQVPEIRRGIDWVPMSLFEQSFGKMYGGSDVELAGLFMFSPDVFAPDSTGWPKIKLYMWNVDRPERPDTLTIPQRTCERIWLDFEPFREEQKWSTMTQDGGQ